MGAGDHGTADPDTLVGSSADYVCYWGISGIAQVTDVSCLGDDLLHVNMVSDRQSGVDACAG